MDSKTYIPQAIRTEAVPAQLNINEVAYHAVLEIAIAAAKLADQFKRRLYYPTPEKDVRLDREKMLDSLSTLHGLSGFLGGALNSGLDLNDRMSPDELTRMTADLPPEVRDFNLSKLNVRLNHAALGCFTESGELLEAVKAQYETGAIDKVNFGEEVGDIEWYQAIGFDETGVTEASCREKNIAKLRKRYPEKFNGLDATERDLAGERAILEGETSHLLASPANAAHLEASLAQAAAGQAVERKLIEG
ncbi:hypothetical protein [Massilia sp. TN1-12]|uniref:hypothetical protein n=1 Tax=Massilia paldalensis TaxID=3377675 RepID=UPI00384D3C82